MSAAQLLDQAAEAGGIWRSRHVLSMESKSIAEGMGEAPNCEFGACINLLDTAHLSRSSFGR